MTHRKNHPVPAIRTPRTEEAVAFLLLLAMFGEVVHGEDGPIIRGRRA